MPRRVPAAKGAWRRELAERVGFEPTVGLPLHMISSRPESCRNLHGGGKHASPAAGTSTKVHEGAPKTAGVGQSECAPQRAHVASCDRPEVAVVRALADAVLAALAAGDTVAARAVLPRVCWRTWKPYLTAPAPAGDFGGERNVDVLRRRA